MTFATTALHLFRSRSSTLSYSSSLSLTPHLARCWFTPGGFNQNGRRRRRVVIHRVHSLRSINISVSIRLSGQPLWPIFHSRVGSFFELFLLLLF
jgi:hypothetical protein